MISAIALVLCIIFVVKLLQIDRAASPGLSKALWVPLLWFLYCATRPLSEWFQGGQRIEGGGGGIESGSMVDRYFLTILLVIGLVILQKRRINWSQTFRNNSWLFALFLFMLISILWSDFPFVSFKRWVRTAGTAVMALVVLSEAEPYEAIYAVLRRTLYLTIPFSVLVVKYYPRLGVTFGRWSGMPLYSGVSLTKNTLGELCVLFVFLYIWVRVARRDNNDHVPAVRGQNICELMLMFMVFYLMKGPSGYGAKSATYSASSTVMLVTGLGVFFLLHRFQTRLTQLWGRVVFVLVGCCVVTAALYLLGTSPMAIGARLLGRDSTLTGRSDLIWPVLKAIAWQNPILGLGYGAFWIMPVPGLTLDVNEAHNGYLDVFLELGLVGLVLLALVVGMYFRKARNELQENFHWASFRMSYLVMFMVHNWTETTLLRSREILWTLFVVFAVVHPKEWAGRIAGSHAQVEEEPIELEASYAGDGIVSTSSGIPDDGTESAR